MVSVIVAVAANGVIGDKNTLLWRLSEDLKRFKALTEGHPIVMGRKTFESLGRPLPKRENVVITRQDISLEGCTVVHSLEEALARFNAETEVFIIGGGEIYAQAMPLADRFYLTVVEADFAGDTSFPVWDREAWELESVERLEQNESRPYSFRFENYTRKAKK